MSELDPLSIAVGGIGFDPSFDGFINESSVGTPIRNRIITQGMGVSRGRIGRAGMVTRGYAADETQFIARPGSTVSTDLIRVPRGRTARGPRRVATIDVIRVWARLSEINLVEVKKKIEGSVAVQPEHHHIMVSAEQVAAPRPVNNVNIFIRRIKR